MMEQRYEAARLRALTLSSSSDLQAGSRDRSDSMLQADSGMPPVDNGRRLATTTIDAQPPLLHPARPQAALPDLAPARPQAALPDFVPPNLRQPYRKPLPPLPAIGGSNNATGGIGRMDKINASMDATNLASTLTDLSLQSNTAYTALSGNSTGNPWDVGSVNPGIRLPSDWHQGANAPANSHTQDAMQYGAQNTGMAVALDAPFAEVAAFSGMLESGKGMRDAVKDMHGARKSGDVRRGVEGGGQFVQSGLGLMNNAWNGMGGMASAAWEATHALGQAGVHGHALDAANGVLGHATTIASQHVPIISIASGSLGMVKSGYQGVDSMLNMQKLTEMRENLGDGGNQELLKYAHDSQRKRRNRAGINLTSSTLTTAGGAMTLSGLGAGFGTATAATGTAVKYGAFGLRKAKQASRDYREKRLENGTSSFLGSAIDKVFDPNVEKSTGKKREKLHKMAAAMIDDPHGLEVFKAIGANKSDCARFVTNRNNPKVHEKIIELLQRRE
jgi:hypothetical protein